MLRVTNRVEARQDAAWKYAVWQPPAPFCGSYSVAALAMAGADMVRRPATAILPAMRRLPPRATATLFDSTKSATRGAISERNREPLKTP
jgi:hypothetical protein